jgi:imidazolonepropionase-like amidohydrolase
MRVVRAAVVSCIVAGLTSTGASQAPVGPANTVHIKNATIVDGSGVKAFAGDILVRDGRIVQVGKIAAAKDVDVLDVQGMVVAPGFIDVHARG